jgi:hypothetical protein
LAIEQFGSTKQPLRHFTETQAVAMPRNVRTSSEFASCDGNAFAELVLG